MFGTPGLLWRLPPPNAPRHMIRHVEQDFGGAVTRIGGEVTAVDSGRPETRLRVVICEDGTLYRECLTIALQTHGIDAAGAWDLPSLFSRLESGEPDVFLLNIGTPDSATLLQVILDIGTDVRVIVTGLSEDRESEIVLCAEAGVAGLHLQTESLEELVAMIRNPTHDEALCSQKVSAILIRRVYSLVGQQNPESPDPMLTERENQIIRLLEAGLSNQQIASRLNVSIHTVKNHAHSMFGKLGVGSRTEAVAAYRAIRHASAERLTHQGPAIPGSVALIGQPAQD